MDDDWKVAEAVTLTCARCGASETINTKSEEKFGQQAAKLGWMLGLPRDKKWCPSCVSSLTPTLGKRP